MRLIRLLIQVIYPIYYFMVHLETGKTSTILALALKIFGKDLINRRVCELNASNEKGICVVRKKIKLFAQNSVTQSKKYKNVPSIKLVILDEADTMTHDAQTSLRRCMEIYSKNTRFCFICNYVTRIIDPIISRCATFRFVPLPKSIISLKINSICENEKLKISNDVLDKICEYSNGDLRVAISALQSLYMLHDDINISNVNYYFNIIPNSLLDDIFSHKLSVIERKQYCNKIILNGYSLKQILIQLAEKIINTDDIYTIHKAHVLQIIATADISSSYGCASRDAFNKCL